MICICFGNPVYKTCKTTIEATGAEIAEIRLDGADLSPADIGKIFSLPCKLIATCRPSDQTDTHRIKLLMTAIISGAAYVDLEVESTPESREEIIKAARLQGCQVILSYHNFETTPPKHELETIIDQCFFFGADIAKISCFSNSLADTARIISLYDYIERLRKTEKSGITGDHNIIAIGMGEKGKFTRVAAPFLGAPFTYSSIAGGLETAPGQIDIKTMEQICRLLI